MELLLDVTFDVVVAADAGKTVVVVVVVEVVFPCLVGVSFLDFSLTIFGPGGVSVSQSDIYI